MLIYAKTNKGKVRASNQDSLLIAHNLYGVADGMGGHRGGETASRVAAQVVKTALQAKEYDEKALRTSVEAANRRVYDMQKRDPALSGMGTTVTVLWEGDEDVLIAHVGDSRAYLFRDGELTHRTEDHSVVAELLRNHVITEEAARTHPYKNVITRAVGVDPAVLIDVARVEKRVGDVWLICSDGLYNMVSDDDIWETLHTYDGDEAAEKLLEMALANGGTDNISLVLGIVTEVAAS